MNGKSNTKKFFLCMMLPAIVLTLAAATGIARTTGIDVEHDIHIELFPAEMKLIGRDVIVVKMARTDILEFRISENLEQVKVEVNGAKRKVKIDGNRLRIKLKANEQTAELPIKIDYAGQFNDPAPVQPVNTDNPGYGVTGTISAKGTFLLAGAGWYPELMNSRATYRISVTAPAGLVAVTAGRSQGHVTENGKTISKWEVDYPVRGLALSVAPYVVEEISVDTVTAATYLLPQNQQLAASYLNATAGYLNLYSELFGLYPFQKFAVVENFFPTGYGFPSYTLMGGSVLRLPFIVHTSLGHEIAHCWWGNGVYVDYAEGNWSEGLTTYVADYLYKEMKSDQAALDARRQWLKNYATLVRPEDDFAVSLFRSRFNPVTKTIGYDKCAMVFHMIRQLIGEEAFWGGLRDLYRDRRFQQTSWADIQRTFESRSKQSLQYIFDQWVYRKGAPQFFIDVIATERIGPNWQITAKVVQKEPLFKFSLDLLLQTEGQPVEKTIDVVGRETSFKLNSADYPRKLTADPHTDLFRQLSPEEIPPAVNSLKGSASVDIVLTEANNATLTKAAKTLIMSLGLKTYRIVAEEKWERQNSFENNLLIIGHPQSNKLFRNLPNGFRFRPKSFSLDDVIYDKPTDAFFGVFDHPEAAGRIVALYLPLSANYAEIVAAKITHYGKYSYLAFQSGRNKAKGFWRVGTSPLIYTWRQTDH